MTAGSAARASEAGLDFLAGGGEMGALMRAHDWRRSSLGPPEGWPPSLRMLVRLMLASKSPMFIAWGHDLAFLYNDACRPILGAKHPAGLGRALGELWSEIWDDLRPRVERVLGGEATYQEDWPLVLDRNGYPEQTWFTSSFTPVHDEAGDIGGLICIGMETTAKLLMERRLNFQIELQDRLRDLADPIEVMAVAAEALGRYVGAAEAGYGEIDAPEESILIQHDWTDGTIPSLAGHHRLADFGQDLIDELKCGRILRVFDVLSDPRIGEGARQAFGAIQVRSVLAVPLVKEGRLTATFFLHHSAPRGWTQAEIGIIEDVAQRTWDAVERARAEAALRKSERRLNAVLNNATVSIIVMDDRQHCIYMNAAAEALTGYKLTETQGKPLHEVVHHTRPDGRPYPLAECPIDRAFPERMQMQGEEIFVHRDGSFYPVAFTASPIRDEHARTVGTIIELRDIRAEKETERQRQLLVNELNHRVKNSLAIVQALANQTFRTAADGEEGRLAFAARLSALAKAHDLLTQQSWEGAELADVVMNVIEAHRNGPEDARFVVAGPPVQLRPKLALSFAMALHELCTNAVKYGALSTDSGRVDVTWTLSGESGTLALRWQESGGPAVTEPRRKGFGSRLLERGLAMELGGEVALAYEPAGVVCAITAPLSEAGA